MTIHELTEAECLDVLSRATVGRLACAHDDQPYVVPISLYFDGTAGVYSVSRVGQKVRWMRDNPKVCVEADEITDRFHWTSVIVMGTYEELTGAGGEANKLRQVMELLQQRSQFWLPATADIEDQAGHSEVVIFRIRITALSGRRTAHSGGMR